jgi:membrane associated rhomboid family serine protease
MVPLRDNNPITTTPYINYGIIAINIIIFLYQLSLNPQQLQGFFYTAALVPCQLSGTCPIALPSQLIPEWMTLITSQFLHGGFLHFGGNMLFLSIFGNNIEDRLGHIKYLIFYLTCGVLAGLSQWFFSQNSAIPSLGASGAIAGVLGAYILRFPRAEIFTLIPFLLANGTEGKLQTLIDDIPDAGQHPNRTIAFGPDKMLYLSVGSTCNACDEPNKEHATLLQVQPDGSKRNIYAKGLRNTIGFAWHPQTRELWGLDHGSDWRGNEQPPEELNLIKQGADYGWPFCWGDRRPDVYLSADPDGATKKEYCAKTESPVLTYTAHSAPLALMFYTASQFPTEYRNDAFVTMRGSWNRNPPSGYKVVRIRYENGKPVKFEDFVTGFLTKDGKAQFGRPVGLATAPDGSLFFTDDTNGVIYRVSYTAK